MPAESIICKSLGGVEESYVVVLKKIIDLV
jgi:hypothetical protein